MTIQTSDVSRRSFLKWSSAVVGSSALVNAGITFVGTPGVGPDNAAWATVEGMADADRTVQSACLVNCGSRCPVRLQVKDGRVVRVLPDNTGDGEIGNQQIRACVRGRSIRQRIYSPDRIMKPLRRRPGTKRGAGVWDEITWDEAYEEIAAQFKRVIETYGNEALYFQYGSGSTGGNIAKRASWTHLLDVLGGALSFYADYSTAQITAAGPYMYGEGEFVKGNSFEDAQYSKLQIMWGNNPIETRMSGGGETFITQQVKKKHKVRTIVIDPRYSETAIDIADEWIPIRPGTDAALASAIAYVLITENMVDMDFIRKYTIGYDEESMPKSVPAGHSYKSYILGQGAYAGEGAIDKGPKSPEWAAPITGVPVETIYRLAREIGRSKPCAITQGWGVQRHANGDTACRAIFMIPILTGNVGLKGGGTGAHESYFSLPVASYPNYCNPIKTQISCTGWYQAIDNGPAMTAVKDGVKGADKLKVGIKLMVNACTNTTMNQHADHNATRKLLEDESKLEYIICHDHQFTTTAQMADIVLPATITAEETDLVPGGSASEMGYLIVAEKAVEPLGEAKTGYEVCREIARRLGREKLFTEGATAEEIKAVHQREGNKVGVSKEEYPKGKTQEQWVSYLIEKTRKTIEEKRAKGVNLAPLPSEEELRKLGVWRQKNPAGTTIAYKEFREDPVKNPLKTPSGKIEIFSKALWDMAHSEDPKVKWVFENPEKGDVIKALPEYFETWEDYAEAKEKGMLQCIGHHYKARTHSSYANLPWIKEANRQEIWINPVDAEARGISNGDLVKVWNDRGKVKVPAKVTPRIVPGVTSLPQGAWTELDADGWDVGGNQNTLARHKFTPLGKGNPQHTCLVNIEKA